MIVTQIYSSGQQNSVVEAIVPKISSSFTFQSSLYNSVIVLVYYNIGGFINIENLQDQISYTYQADFKKESEWVSLSLYSNTKEDLVNQIKEVMYEWEFIWSEGEQNEDIKNIIESKEEEYEIVKDSSLWDKILSFSK